MQPKSRIVTLKATGTPAMLPAGGDASAADGLVIYSAESAFASFIVGRWLSPLLRRSH
jgi:hypothetical protein